MKNISTLSISRIRTTLEASTAESEATLHVVPGVDAHGTNWHDGFGAEDNDVMCTARVNTIGYI